jgi:2-C-methyl-D-erythritol 2,4-cyclodiphosphate synthase
MVSGSASNSLPRPAAVVMLHYHQSLVLLVIVALSWTTKPCNAFTTISSLKKLAQKNNNNNNRCKIVTKKNRLQQHQRHHSSPSTQLVCASEMTIEENKSSSNEEIISPLPSILRPTYTIEPLPIRIGHGFDIHRLVPISEAQQPIIIGGVIIDHVDQPWTDTHGTYTNAGPNTIYTTQLGVLAHSDGDVIYHSLVDAIFGALTLPDIGQVFQDTDVQWKGCDSSTFMQVAYNVLQYYGYNIGNIDVTLILERPKVANYKANMKANIVKLLHTTDGRVNIKARTHERLDSIGELRAVSCHVVVTLEKKTKPNLIEGAGEGEENSRNTNKESFKGF